MENFQHELRFASEDDLQIACSRWQSRGPARGAVQIAHGLGEHMGRYSMVPGSWNAADRR